MNRRDFIKFATVPGILILAPFTSACQNDLSMQKVFDHIHALQAAKSLEPAGNQTAYQIIVHCTQSIDCALEGYPESKAAWVQNTAGKAAFHAFSLLSRMKHDLNAPIPGLTVAAVGDAQEALQKLEASFQKLHAARQVHPHFFYGQLSQPEMEKAQIMHFWNHMEVLKVS